MQVGEGQFEAIFRELAGRHLRLKSECSLIRLKLAAARLRGLLHKANFDPNQPRVPAGNPDGGQWASAGGSGDRSQTGADRQQVAARRRRYRRSPAQRAISENTNSTKRRITQINPRERFLEPMGGSTSRNALRAYGRRLRELQLEAHRTSVEISHGHSYAKHRFEPGHRDTPGHTRFRDVYSRQDYAARVYDTIVNGTHSKALGSGRTIYFNAKTNTIVIVNARSPNEGTAFPAFHGIATYNGITR